MHGDDSHVTIIIIVMIVAWNRAYLCMNGKSLITLTQEG